MVETIGSWTASPMAASSSSASFVQVDPDQRHGIASRRRPRPAGPTDPVGRRTAQAPTLGGQDRRAEATMALLINLIIFAGIVLLPLALAFIFMRLRRRFSSYY